MHQAKLVHIPVVWHDRSLRGPTIHHMVIEGVGILFYKDRPKEKPVRTPGSRSPATRKDMRSVQMQVSTYLHEYVADDQ